MRHIHVNQLCTVLGPSVFGTPLTASSPSNALVSTNCIICMWLTTSGSTLCQYCHLEKTMSPSEVKCAPELILLLLSDVMVVSIFEVDHPTRSEMHMVADILRREVSSSFPS